MTIETHNWASSAHQEFHKIVREEILPIVNQVDAMAVVSQDIISVVQNASVVVPSDLQTELERFQKLENANVELEFQVFNYAKENAHLKATYKNLFDSISVSRAQTVTKIASLQNELQCNIYKNAKLRTQLFKKVSDVKANTQNLSKNTKFAKQPIVETLPKIGESNALSKTVTSNSVSTPQVSKGVNNAKVIAPGMFRISSDKISREAKKVPNTVSASSRTKPITVSQPSVITKKGINSNSNGLSSTGLDNTKTRRPQPRNNSKNDRVPSASKSSRSLKKVVKVEEPHRNLLLSKKNKHSSSAYNTKTRRPQPRSNSKNDRVPSAPKCSQSMNKDVKVEEHHRNLLLSKKNKHSSSACNNSKIDSLDVISKVVCAISKKCLISVNHDECLVNYVNGKKSRGRKHKAHVSKNETQKEYRPKVSKSKNVGTRESLATPKPRKPRFLLRWSPTGKMFDSAGKTVAPSGDNACASNKIEPKIKRFPSSTSLLGRLSRFVYGMFRIISSKTSKEEKQVPNTVSASARTKPITVSQPTVITKKDVPRSNTKNDRVPSASKSSRSKNKEAEVEEHHRNLLLSKNNKHISSACNNFMRDSQNVYSKVVCAMCKQCLISVNHDKCLLNYVNDKNSRGKKQSANVSIKEKQKNESRSKIIASSESESQSGCSKGDNACTSNPVEPTIKWFPNSTFSLAGNSNMFMFMGTVRFENDQVAAILGFGVLQWGNILITRVYFVEGLGHNLFSVGQFCDSNIEVAFKRNACFVKNLERVDLLKGDPSSNLYTINIQVMAFASPISKSWLWHQRLSHLNFDTINDLARNDLVAGLS
nr:hypothetical protein [Tanacetum cinerariifolium]